MVVVVQCLYLSNKLNEVDGHLWSDDVPHHHASIFLYFRVLVLTFLTLPKYIAFSSSMFVLMYPNNLYVETSHGQIVRFYCALQNSA